MSSAALPGRVDRLEAAMAEMALADAEARRAFERFTLEMRRFAEESRTASNRADQRMDELARHNGRITNKLGRLVEDIVGPSVPGTFMAVFGATPDQISGIRIKRTHPVHRAIREFDAVAVGGETFLVVDVKSQQTPESIERFVTGLPETREYFPDWMQGRRLFGAVASFHVDPSLVATAERRGLLVFGLARDLIDLLNTPGFEPREY